MAIQDNQVQSLRTPPHNIVAEQSLLGGLILDSSAWLLVSERVTEKDFYFPQNRLIFLATSYLCKKNRPCDIVTLSEILEKQGRLNDAGGMSYLTSLVDTTPSIANITAYADIVREHSIFRGLLASCQTIANTVFNPNGKSSTDLLELAEQEIFAIAELGQRTKKGFRDVNQILTTALERIEAIFNNGGKLSGIPTGFDDLDEKTSGLQRSDLIIVAGRPSMGKTSFAMNIAENVVLKDKLPIAIFSMEMSSAQLGIRLLASNARIDQKRVRDAKLDDSDWDKMITSITRFDGMPLFIDDTPALTPNDLRTRARRLVQEQGQLGLIIVDYLQLMRAEGKNTRVEEISEISRSLKALAKELNVPVIALSQLNRTLENRPNKRPVMSDLRESGAIEQDADVIIFIYRDEVYNEESEDKGIAEIIIGKQRNGPIGTVRLAFLNSLTRFENMENPTRKYDEYFTSSNVRNGLEPAF